MSCPSPEELLRVAFAGAPPGDVTQEHSHTCASCAGTIDRWREVAALMQLTEDDDGATASCLDELAIAGIATGNAAALTEAAKRHLSACARCRAQLADAIDMLRASEIAAEVVRLDKQVNTSSRKLVAWPRIALLAAALAGVLLIPSVIRRGGNGSDNGTRDLRDTDATITRTSAPRILSPVGQVGSVSALTWSSVPGAGRYGVRLFASDGTVVWESETNDTTVALPASVQLMPGSVYLLQVEAHTSWNRSAQSELIEFSIRKP